MSQFEKHGLFCMHSAPAIKDSYFASKASYFWFRVLGYGLHFRWIQPGYEPLFSERNGYTKVLKIGRFWIKGLKP